ncbi:BgTH12-05574 [Blumeria graminis f. sp. triticale]|nr:BgTH12-05574 [Blumeria graminis f. sp. triticale]
MLSTLTLLTIFATVQGASLLPRGMTCRDVLIPTVVNTSNDYIDPTINSQAKARSWMQKVDSHRINSTEEVDINDKFNIAARYCEPEVKNPSRANTIQLLVHGITYTKNYWSGLGPPGEGYNGDSYSWIAYASKQGYPTLSIDRLGNGDSDRPDGIAAVQMSSHVEVAESLVNTLKNSTVAGRRFEKVIYVGHSYGSLIGNLHSVHYPDSVDSYVLTGFSKNIRASLTPTLITGDFRPARMAYPEKWGGQTLSYFAASSESGADGLFFTDETVDPNLKALNFRQRGTVTVGEFVSGYESIQVATNYHGHVFVLTGKNDAIFCSPDDFGQGTLSGRGDCGTGEDSIIAKTRELYPAAVDYSYSTPENTGHCNILHLNAQEQFATVHNWLARFY